MASGKALVTGGTGFIGSHLVEALLGHGNAVRCLVREDRPRGWIQKFDVEWVSGDCIDVSTLLSAVEGVDRVYHLAGISRATETDAFYRTNAVGTENVVRACMERNPDLERFVYISSQAAAGPCMGEGLVVETDPCWPISHYGKSKCQGEEAVLKVRDRLKVVVLRPCSVYGPRDRGFLPLFRSVRMGIQFGLWGIEQRISLCYVDDLVSAALMAGERDIPSGEVFFISDGNVHTSRDLCRTIAETLNVRTISIRLPIGVFRWAVGVSDWISNRSGRLSVFCKERCDEMIQPNWGCDPSKAMSQMGFSPSFDLGRGVAATVAWYQAAGWLGK
jgi:nucleoside-diphosphate-sugar epimerase